MRAVEQLGKPGLSKVLIKTVKRDNILANMDIIGCIDFFEQIPLKRVSDLIRCIREVKYKADEFVIREGTKGINFYVVKKGVCKVYSKKPGRE